MNLLAAGKANKEMAKALDISPATVASYLASIYRKLGVKTRAHAVAMAIAEGIIVLNEVESQSLTGRQRSSKG